MGAGDEHDREGGEVWVAAGGFGESVRPRHLGRAFVAALVATVAPVGIAAPPAGAQPVIVIEPSPVVANQPFTVTVEGCAPNAAVEVRVTFTSGLDDVGVPVDVAGGPAVTDAAGRVTVPVPFAYPLGDPPGWRVTVSGAGCDGSARFGVPNTPDQTVTSTGTIAAGSVLTVSGGGCLGDRVDVSVVSPADKVVLGWPGVVSGVPGPTGAWSVPVTLGPTTVAGSVRVLARCHYADVPVVGGSTSELYALYGWDAPAPAETSTTTVPSSSTTVTAPPAGVGPAAAVAAQPAFTG